MSTTGSTANDLLAYHQTRSLPDGRIIVSTNGGSHFALTEADWVKAMNDIASELAMREQERERPR